MPDPAGLQTIAAQLDTAHTGAVLGHTHALGRAELQVDPQHVPAVMQDLHDRGYRFLVSVFGLDYYPHEPRLGVVYELLDMQTVDRISVKTRVTIDDPTVGTVTHIWPGANFPERECFDMFGVVFDGHPDLRRILMPEDYEGHPQRRDFPIGGEPVLFTYNEETSYGKYQ